jgi:hypothetical protein
MSSNTKKKRTYVFTYNKETNTVTKTDKDTGVTWSYSSRARNNKPAATSKNGVTVEKLLAAGNKVRVKHLRWAVYLGHKCIGDIARLVVVPSSFRKDPNYFFAPKGGYTHVVIQRPAGDYLCVSSECSQDDPFCYAAGVCTALDRLVPEELDYLGV